MFGARLSVMTRGPPGNGLKKFVFGVFVTFYYNFSVYNPVGGRGDGPLLLGLCTGCSAGHLARPVTLVTTQGRITALSLLVHSLRENPPPTNHLTSPRL